jgi:hypothetical protein
MTDDGSIEDPLDDLDDLIRFLEKEKEWLKNCVDEASQELEFSQAKAFEKAYRYVEKRLDTLKNLRDPTFDERARLYRTLVLLEEQIKTYADVPHLFSHLTEQLRETNRALDKLESSSYSPIDSQHVDDAVFQLVNGDIESFRLHLNKSKELVFDFVCENRLVQIGLSYKKGSLSPSREKTLRVIGFSKVDSLRRFVRSVDVTNFKDAQSIKQVLAVVIFDVFDRSWFDNPAELEIAYKDHPGETPV